MITELNKRSRKRIFKYIFHVDTLPIFGLVVVLIGFLIIEGSFRPINPWPLNTPKQYFRAGCVLPSFNVCAIYVTKDEGVYFDINYNNKKAELLTYVGGFYNVSFTQRELKTFSEGNFFGDNIYSFN